MAAEREISAREMVTDIVSGIGDTELMNKYRLTFRGLQNVFRQLVDLRLIEAALLKGRIVPRSGTETTIVARPSRKEIYIPLSVQDVDNPGACGIVTNLNERGLGVKGMTAAVDEVRHLAVRPEKLFQLKPFTLKVKCRWVKTSKEPSEIMAGFETISIAHNDLQRLKSLIETLEYMYR